MADLDFSQWRISDTMEVIVILAIICIHSFQWSSIRAQKFSTGISLTMITSFAAVAILQGAFYIISFAKTDETKTPFDDAFVPLDLHDYVIGARIIAQVMCTNLMAMVTALYVERHPIIAMLTSGGALMALCSLSYIGIYLWIGSRGCPEDDYDSLRCMTWRAFNMYGAIGLAGLALLVLVCGLLHQIWLVMMRNGEWTASSPVAMGLQAVAYLLVQRGGIRAIPAAIGSWIIGVVCLLVVAVHYCASSFSEPAVAGTRAERQPLVDVKYVL